MKPATPDEIASALSFALLFNGRRRAHGGDTLMADIVAKRLVEHLELCGFVLMKGEPARAPVEPRPRAATPPNIDTTTRSD